MKKNIRKFNLTPQAHKSIIETARTLPQMVRLNPDGSQMARDVTKFKGVEYIDEKGNKSEKPYNHFTKGKEPVFINHEVEMINRFWQHGEPGVQAYVDSVHAIVARHEAKEVTVNPELVEQLAGEIEKQITKPQTESNESNS